MKAKIKKNLKNIKFKYLLFTILGVAIGGVIFGTLGIVATTNKLEAKYVMYTKDGETMTVQDAIKDLYVLVKNNEGNNQTLPLGDVTVSGTQITIPYTGTYDKITCVYGTTESYGSTGTISGNTCTFSGSSNTKYYYKLVATKIANNTGVVYENSGNKTTSSGPTAVKTGLPTGVKAIVYLDPTDLSKSCNASNSTVGSGTSGCMKWYAFSEDNTSYTMILDHNTSSSTSIENENVKLTYLQSGNGWKLTPRSITAQEVATITGNTSWTKKGNGFFFDDACQRYDCNCDDDGNCDWCYPCWRTTSLNEYYWLFDYTDSCSRYGCFQEDFTDGYWTDTMYTGPNSGGSILHWYVESDGLMTYGSGADEVVGVRPVITVSKSNF